MPLHTTIRLRMYVLVAKIISCFKSNGNLAPIPEAVNEHEKRGIVTNNKQLRFPQCRLGLACKS